MCLLFVVLIHCILFVSRCLYECLDECLDEASTIRITYFCKRVLWLLMFWTVVVLEFLRYAWIRMTGLFIYGSQERRATTTVDEANYERRFRSRANTLHNRQRAHSNVNSRHFRDISS